MFNSSSSVRHCRSQKQLWDQTCLAEGCFCPYGRTSSACVLFTTRCTPLVAELFPWPDRNKQPCSPSQDFGNQVHANNLSTNLRCALQEARRFTGVGMVIQAQKKLLMQASRIHVDENAPSLYPFNLTACQVRWTCLQLQAVWPPLQSWGTCGPWLDWLLSQLARWRFILPNHHTTDSTPFMDRGCTGSKVNLGQFHRNMLEY